MTMYYFVRSVPLLVGVEATDERTAWHLAGNRVDDFMSDAMEMVKRVSHIDETPYVLEYQGDAIYTSRIRKESLSEQLETVNERLGLANANLDVRWAAQQIRKIIEQL